jgi:putative SOS response-associated peptidase YedK
MAEWSDLDLSIMPWFAPSYNATPQSFQPVVRLSGGDGQREAAPLRWELAPSRAKDNRIGPLIGRPHNSCANHGTDRLPPLG